MNRIVMMLASVVLIATTSSLADEIGYVEDFALAKQRSEALKQLIPGTEDYYYYHCLDHQHNEQFDDVEKLLVEWIKRYKYTARVHEIRNRQALLTYANTPQKSLDYLRNRLNLRFNHQRETIVGPKLPTTLDPKLISRETLTGLAKARHKNLQGFEHKALDWLVATDLNPDRRRHLLERLQRPDYPNLPKLVVDDLNYRYSKGFGSFTIHRQLLLTQLDECLKLKPDLLNQTHFVNAYLSKLRPHADIDWRNDSQQHAAYLDRMWGFVNRLAPVHNSLKAHVLYQRLVFDRTRGVYDKERFMAYIKLPKSVVYVNPKYLERPENRKYRCNLQASYEPQTLLPIIGNDEPLVRSYLHRFFIKETNYKPYEAYVNDLYLKHNFAETKIVNGLGDPEQWYSMLPPSKYQQLKERIDLDFEYANKRLFGADEAVGLDLLVKNVKTLIVKVYEINTRNYYRENLRPIDTSINLDGLVANEESTQKYSEGPLRRVRRHFEFPSLKKRGTYVIDFIGNGKSSRVLVQKGKLRYLVRSTVAGHQFTVLDEANRKLPQATIWVSGREYTPDEDGTINIPFSNRPGRAPIVLGNGEFHCLDSFGHEAENYALSAGMHVDRESLLERKKARVVIRTGLALNGLPVTLSVLEDVRLMLSSTDHDGVTTTKEVKDFKLFEDRDSEYEFQVPARLSQITFSLAAKVKNLSQSKTIDLAAQQTFSLNEIVRTEKVEDLHFLRSENTYVVDLLGRSGEPLADRPVQLVVKHGDFLQPVHVTLQTDAMGRITLGELADIVSVQATSPQGSVETLALPHDAATYHQSLHGKAGGAIVLPYMGGQNQPMRSEFSLLELRGNTFLADRFEALAIADGFLQVNGLAAGEYDLLLKESGTRVRLRLGAGEQREGYVLGDSRLLEQRGTDPLQIERVDVAEQEIAVRLRNATKFSRVHVFAVRYMPAFSAFENLSRVRDAEPFLSYVPKAPTTYVAGRNLGDEYRYIIERQYARKFPSNMLKKPSLLLNPWPIRTTETGKQNAAAGTEFDAEGDSKSSTSSRGAKKSGRVAPRGIFGNLDFLPAQSVVLLNLEADDKGVVTITRDDVAGRQTLFVVAVDPAGTISRSVSLKETPSDFRDLRLAKGLDPKLQYAQQKQISVIPAQGEFTLADITSSRFEAYDSVSRVYRLYATLSNDAKLKEFGFIVNWPSLNLQEKQEKYSKYACHELNFFLYKKDRKFFDEVVRGYLKNKRDKTFLDRWLLAEDLSGYLKPWEYSQLNIVERVLLSRRLEGEQEFTSRDVADLYAMLPPDLDRYNFLFRTAIKGSALDADDAFDFEESAEKARGTRMLSALVRSGGEKPADETLRRAPSSSAAPAKPPAPMSEAVAARDESLSEEMELSVRGRFAKKSAAKRKSGFAYGATFDAPAAGEEAANYFKDLADKRAEVRQLYRKLDKTQEWVENNYYRLPIEQQNGALVAVNAFWRDYANHDPQSDFYSVNLCEASRNFSEMMFALSVLDVPFEAGEHATEFQQAKMTLNAGSPMIVFHREIKPVEAVLEDTPILVSQNFFRHGDRYRQVNNERVDKYVTEEFLVHTVYGCQVVVTNPTSSRQKLSVLLQIPVGAIPVLNGQVTRSVPLDLKPYHTQTLEYHFYFPSAGESAHYPVHVAKNEELVARAEPFVLNVVNELSNVDRESWDFVSQHGANEDVLRYLREKNLHRVKLDRIAFRMQDAQFHRQAVALLARRHLYDHTLWSYGVSHDFAGTIREYLQHSDAFVNECGQYIDSPLLTIDPLVRKTYQHMDYNPLVNARSHQLGKRRQILNDRFYAQYHRLLKVLSYRRQLTNDDLMALTYYMLLQNRIEEAIEFFGRVNSQDLVTRLQYDYFAAYLDLFTDEHKVARKVAQRWLSAFDETRLASVDRRTLSPQVRELLALGIGRGEPLAAAAFAVDGRRVDYPVNRWREAFADVVKYVDEIDGKLVRPDDSDDRTKTQTEMAATEPNLELTVEAKQVRVNYQNIDEVEVNFYKMDIELLFSRNPFVQQHSGQFASIRPNATRTIKLSGKEASHTFDLPEEFHTSNVLVEVIGGGQRKSQAYYANSLTAQVIENYGQIRVTQGASAKPVTKVYVKVYARMKDGRVQFFKDGYTDLRGRFDYTSLNTNELDHVSKFSLLVLSEKLGALVVEANPPRQ